MIGIIARTWFTTTKGGSERYIKRVFDELTKKHEVIAVTLDSECEKNVIHIKFPRIPFITQLLFSFAAARKINKLRPDACIVNQYWGELSPLLLKVPFIPILHDVGLFTSKNAKKQIFKYFFRIRILERVVRKSKVLVVPSKLTSDDLQLYLKVPPEKIKVVNEGVDADSFKGPKIEHEGVNILCVARIAPNKGHDILINAFRIIKQNHPNCRLILVGGVSKENKLHYERLKKLAEFNRNDIFFAGQVSDSELVKYYKMADIYVQPSIGEEGWGITIAEAFASDLPVVCTDIFQKTGIVSHERALIVKPGDVLGLANAIQRLIVDEKLRMKLSQKGAFYSKELSWHKTTEEILKIVNTVLKKSKY